MTRTALGPRVRRRARKGQRLLREKNRLLWVPAILCAVVLGLCVLVAHPAVNMGVNDEFTYSWSARVLADTGRVTYPGWGAVLLGWQLYWGALFIKLFGFSFGTLRLSIFLIALGTTAFLERVFVRCGLNEWNAVVATLTIVLSPIFLPLSFGYMSDVPAMLCFLLCLYGCVRALEAETDRAALGWLAFAALMNAAVGTVRQITWLGVLVLVPGTAWLMRRRRGALLMGAVLWIVCTGWIVYWLQWFKVQPYAIVEGVITREPIPFRLDIHSAMTANLWMLPVLIAFLVAYPFTGRRNSVGSAVAIGAAVLTSVAMMRYRNWLAPFSVDEVSAKGIDIPNTMLGQRPDVFPLWLRVVLTCLIAAATVAVVLWFVRARESADEDQVAYRVSDRSLYMLLGAYSLVYVGLITTRQIIFDRYWIPILVVYLILLLRFFQRRIAMRLPIVSVVVLVLLCVFSVVSTHDLYATYRARLGAIDELRSAGIPKGEIDGGAEFDGWTELELVGHINHPRVQVPAGAHVFVPPSNLPAACTTWYRELYPELHPRYAISYNPVPCFKESEFEPFAYRTWLGPRQRYLYVSAIR